jgi:hypothetical protein
MEGRVSAQSRAKEEMSTYDLSQLRQVKDPWSHTQQPFGRMMNARTVRMGADELDSIGMVVVNFRENSSTLERDYMDNARALEILGRTFRDRESLITLDYMVITATSSPEGYETRNEELAAGRALAVKSYIMWRFPYVDRDMIYTFSAGEDWAGLRREVEQDRYVPGQWEVLYLLDSHQSNDAKKAALKKIAGGRAYSYISRFILPSLRGGAAVSLHMKVKPQSVAESEKKRAADTVYVERIIERIIERLPAANTVEKRVTDTVYIDRVTEPQPVKQVDIVKKPLFAVKTNLLFDLGTAINIEAEVPIGKHWSLAGEWIFPWWLIKNDQIALEGGVGTLEVRSYMGVREGKRPLTGWFLGMHGGWGYYDLEWKNKGYQGKFLYGGFSAGYAHTVSKNGNWRMEYSLGLGSIQTTYTEYTPQKDDNDTWHLVRQREATRLWVGPTQAKISLVWMLGRNSKKKGDKQ